MAALDDLDRPGRPRQVEQSEVVAATLTKPPARLGVTHWSSRLLAKELGIGNATVAKIWRRWDLQPWRVETFEFSTDPELDAKIRDVVGLHMNPPENAIVVCVDEKTPITGRHQRMPWGFCPGPRARPARSELPVNQPHHLEPPVIETHIRVTGSQLG
jgi:hypothetical protein